LWSEDGEALTVSALGNDVPAFSAKTVIAPDRALLTSPTCTNDGVGNFACGQMQQGSQVTLQWSGGTNSKVLLTLVDPNQSTAPWLACEFFGDAHSGTIAPSLLAALPAGDHQLSYGAINTSSFDAGAYAVKISAEYEELLGGTVTVTAP
jgi:hypothetical protein